MPVEPLGEETLARLRACDTPTICNVIELFAVRPRNTGFMDSRICACFPELPPICGYAATATFRAAFPRGDSVYATLDEQVRRFEELPGPPIVVFQDLDDPPAAATFGEIMCASYQCFGAAGLITSGAARDLDQVRRLRFPCFSSGAICAHGYSHIVALNLPLRVGGLPVLPGDLLHADANGITSIPREIAADVADAAEEYAACEAVVLNFLKEGRQNTEGRIQKNDLCSQYAQARTECMRLIEQLGDRLRTKPKHA